MRTKLLLLTLATLTLGAAACSKNKATCEKYTDWAMKCDKDTSMKDDEKDAAKSMLTGMCIAAFDGEYGGAKDDEKKMMQEMYDHLKAEATCAEKASSCEDYKKCEDAGKAMK